MELRDVINFEFEHCPKILELLGNQYKFRGCWMQPENHTFDSMIKIAS